MKLKTAGIIIAIIFMISMCGCAEQEANLAPIKDGAKTISEPMTKFEYVEPEPEPEPEPEYYYEYSGSYSGYNNDFKSQGVVYDNGTRYTWYSQNVLPGGGLTELNNNGRHVDDQGFIRDGDGYLAVASSDYPKGTIVSTPWGDAKVYDDGCSSGTIDMYTDF